MAERDYSSFQKKVIQRYYDNREQLDHQRLAELVTSLYLATPKQAGKLWDKAGEMMSRLKVPPSRIAHVLAQKDAAVLAGVVEDLQSGKIGGT